MWSLDALVVAVYFAIVFSVGAFARRRLRSASADEFVGGARTLGWRQAALAVIAMTADPGILGTCGLAFVWGFELHWNAVNLWLAAPCAAAFLLPIYWRTGIATTAGYLEARFSRGSRRLMAALMLAFNVVVLAVILQLGGLLLNAIFHWPVYVAALVVLALAALYIVGGGMRALLVLNRWQSALVLLTLVAVACAAVHAVGGIDGFARIRELSQSGRALPSTLPANDYSPFTRMWFPWPAIVLWAPLMSTAWLACNHSFVQCFLATRSLADAQKSLLAVGAWVFVMTTLAFAAGVAMHALRPTLLPDQAFIQVILTMFPTGVRGLLIAGLMASLLASVSGILMASGTLASVDLFAHARSKTASRLAQLVVIVAVLLLLPHIARSRSVTAFLQHFMGNVYGVIAAWYLVGVFSRRATARAAWLGALIGIAVAVALDTFTRVNFAYIGFLSFASASVAMLGLSRLEAAPDDAQLRGLTVYDSTASNDADRAWPHLARYAVVVFVVYTMASIAWELYIR